MIAGGEIKELAANSRCRGWSKTEARSRIRAWRHAPPQERKKERRVAEAKAKQAHGSG